MKRETIESCAVQKILTILGPLWYASDSLGPYPESENLSIYHGLIREIGHEMNRKNKNNFFHTCYPELIQAHLTGKQKDLNNLCRKLQVDLRPYAARLASNYHFTTIDLNDFIQEGLIGVHLYLPRYRYICPECSERFERGEGFSEHCNEEHGLGLEPKQGIESFLSGIVRGHMLNFLRHQFQLKRTPVAVVHASDFFESDKNQICIDLNTPSPEMLVASKEAVENVRACLDKERNEKIRVFVSRILSGYTAPEAYLEISEQGLASSDVSARVTIYQLKKTRAFNKYRQVLAG